MINEKMLEYLMLSRILSYNEVMDDDKRYYLRRRLNKLEDEFIKEQLAYLPPIKSPEKEITKME